LEVSLVHICTDLRKNQLIKNVVVLKGLLHFWFYTVPKI